MNNFINIIDNLIFHYYIFNNIKYYPLIIYYLINNNIHFNNNNYLLNDNHIHIKYINLNH